MFYRAAYRTSRQFRMPNVKVRTSHSFQRSSVPSFESHKFAKPANGSAFRTPAGGSPPCFDQSRTFTNAGFAAGLNATPMPSTTQGVAGAVTSTSGSGSVRSVSGTASDLTEGSQDELETHGMKRRQDDDGS